MHLNSVKPHRGVVRTPLRYPGGKTRLTGFLRRVIEAGAWTNLTYVEPYAGGAGAALSLLHDHVVSRIVINDLDPCIHAFWHSVTTQPENFLERFDTTPLTLEEWSRQREVYRAGDTSDLVALGFATFFLNRTNRSGVMNAGVIGGQSQAGRYKLDARFNRVGLRKKLEWIAVSAERIQVSNSDGLQVLKDAFKEQDVLCYIDPPYFEKGAFLYMNSLAADSHAALAELLRANRGARWILTYDDVESIRLLYNGFNQGTFSLPYSAHRAELANERMVLSDSVACLPGIT